MLPVGEHLLDGGVGDAGSDDGGGHRDESFVCGAWVVTAQILAEVLEGVEWSLTCFEDGPHQHAGDFDSLHFLSDLLSGELNSVHFGWELGDLVKWALEGLEADTGLDHLSTPHDDHPLAGATLNPEGLHVLDKGCQAGFDDDECDYWNNQTPDCSF